MKTGFIYLWTNVANGKKYLGSHVGAESDGYMGSGDAFRNAVKKYGKSSFERTILERDIPKENILFREQFYLDHYRAATDRDFYNIRAKSGGGFEHINGANRVHPRGMLGKTHSAATRSKMAKSIKAALTETIGIPVWCFTLSGDLVGKYESISDAANSVSGSPSNVKYTCEGKFSSAYGKLWSYTDQCPSIPDQNSCKKQVVTPVGTFPTISAGAAALKINPLTLKRRIWKNIDGYYWKDG